MFLTKVEPNYENDTQDSKPESSEDTEEKLSKVQCESYSSEKGRRDSNDGKVQLLCNSSDISFYFCFAYILLSCIFLQIHFVGWKCISWVSIPERWKEGIRWRRPKKMPNKCLYENSYLHSNHMYLHVYHHSTCNNIRNNRYLTIILH